MYQCWHRLYQQIFKFSITGLLNTAIDFGLFNVLLSFTHASSTWQIGVINLVSVSCAATNSFLLNRHWTFPSQGADKNLPVLRFAVATIIGLLINTLVVTGVGSLTPWIPISAYLLLNVAKLLGALLGSTWNFVIYRVWVFAEVLPGIRITWILPALTSLTSIIIPAYNEETRLPKRLSQLQPLLDENNIELIIVDDGSSDHTRRLALDFAALYPEKVQVLSHPANSGKGAAVRTGIGAARGEYLIFTDADTTFSLEHIRSVQYGLQSGNDIVIGHRAASEGGRLAGEKWTRLLIGRGFNLIVRGLGLTGIRDTQCGLKGFSRLAANTLFSRLKINGFAFDVELLALAPRLGWEINIQEVQAQDCDGSSVNCRLAVINMGMALLSIWWGLHRNSYQLPKIEEGINWRLAFGLFVTALAVRIPWLWEVPRYIDELKEVSLAYAIYRGQAWPLTNMAHDIGAMHNYILAGIFKLFGVSIYWPRLYIAVTSAITVVLVYELGRRLFGRTVGLLAAGLLLTNGMHILVSHMAWSNSSTSFFFVLALLALLRAEEKGSGVWLVWAGLLWAAALQTHSSVIVYVLVAAAYVLSPSFRSKTRINWSWYWGGTAAFLAGYTNMIYFNLVSHGGSIVWAAHKQYTLEMHPGLFSYLENTAQMGVELLRSLGSVYQDPIHIKGGVLFFILLVFLVLVIGLARGIKAGKTLPALMMLGAFLVIPWINQRYSFYLATRYIMPVIICGLFYMAVGMTWMGQTVINYRQWATKFTELNSFRWSLNPGLNIGIAFFTRLFTSISNWVGTGIARKRVLVAYGLIVLMLIAQLVPFYRYCDRLIPTNESNRMAMSIFKLISQPGTEKRVILIDNDLQLENKPLPYLLTITRQRYVILNSAQGKVNWANIMQKYPNATVYAVMSEQNFSPGNPGTNYTRIHELHTRVSIPTPSTKPRHVYVLQLSSPK